jgi:hypothetical protein
MHVLGLIRVGLFSFSRRRVLETCKFMSDGTDRNRKHVSDSSFSLVQPKQYTVTTHLLKLLTLEVS